MSLADMTTDQIRTMPPSREMDRLVAVALGWHDYHEPSLPHYSSRHAAALEALERYAETAHIDKISKAMNTDYRGWTVAVTKNDNMRTADGPDGLPGLALAICRAILLAEKGTP